MVAMQTEMETELLHWAGMRQHVLNAASFLEKRVGRSAVNPKAEWKLVKSLGGIPAAHVRVSDDGAEAEATFAMHELADPYFVRQRIYDLWNSLLERRLDIHDERYRVLSAASAEG